MNFVRSPRLLSNFVASFGALLIVAVASLTACSGGAKPACAPGTLETIEADYVAEMQAKCKGYTRATCPATDDIETRYRDKRQAWISCH